MGEESIPTRDIGTHTLTGRKKEAPQKDISLNFIAFHFLSFAMPEFRVCPVRNIFLTLYQYLRYFPGQ